MDENYKLTWNYTSTFWKQFEFALKTNNRNSFKAPEEIYRVLRKIIHEHPVNRKNLPKGLAGMLVHNGLLISMPDFREVYFDIPLNKDLLDFIPYKDRNLTPVSSDKSYIINPGLFISTEKPSEELSLLTECLKNEIYLNPDSVYLWIKDSLTGITLPFRAGEEILHITGEIISGRKKLSDLTEEIFTLFVYTGILLPSDYEQERLRRREIIKQASLELNRKKYLVLRNIISPIQLAALRIYYRQLAEKGLFKQGDTQVEKRDHIINEHIARLLHFQLLETINQTVPEKIKPSYCFLSRYRPGAVLKRHTDREQCIWNMSVVFDLEPEHDRSSAWPIYLETREEVHEVRMEMGDGVLYRGSEIPHWREQLPENHHATVCFYHFVPEAFQGKLV